MSCTSAGGCGQYLNNFCKPLPPILIDPSDEELMMLLVCWRKQGGPGGSCSSVPFIIEVDPEHPNIPAIMEYCRRRSCLQVGEPFQVDDPDPGDLGGPPIGGPAAVVCGPTGDTLAVAMLDPNTSNTDGSVSCSAGTPEIQLIASGGTEPYTWTIDNANEDCEHCDADGPEADCGDGVQGCVTGIAAETGQCGAEFVLTRPCTFGTGISAYMKIGEAVFNNATFPPCFSACVTIFHLIQHIACDGSLNSCQDFFCPQPTLCTDGVDMCDHPRTVESGTLGPCRFFCHANTWDGCANTLRDAEVPTNAIFCDRRTQAQKDAGCCPCYLQFDNLQVTVTDADSTSVTVTLTSPNP